MIEYSQTLIGRTIIGSLERGSKNFDKSRWNGDR